MILEVRADLTYDFPGDCETLVLVEAARTGDQTVHGEALQITPAVEIHRRDDESSGERAFVFTAAGRVTLAYQAHVAVERAASRLAGAPSSPIRDLPRDALRYLRPSRYCPSDRFESFVEREFAGAGGAKVEAILGWIRDHVDYRSGVSDVRATALDTFIDRAGVCRDFAHLAIALCRAADIPARAVSAYAWKLDPPDLHAVAEVYVGGRWVLVDPTGMASPEHLVRIATGADAADIAFLSIFGEATLISQAFAVTRREAACG